MLAWFKPSTPVWTGAGLLMLVIMSAKQNFSAPSAKYRRSATKRMGILVLFGVILMLMGRHTNCAPWYMSAASAEEARCVMFSLFAYCAAMLGAPTIAWAYVSYPKCPKKRRIIVRRSVSLPRLAEKSARVQVKIAV